MPEKQPRHINVISKMVAVPKSAEEKATRLFAAARKVTGLRRTRNPARNSSMHVAKRMTQDVSNITVPNPQPATIESAKRGISNGLISMTRQKTDLMLVALKQTIVAILMAINVELGATQWTEINVGSIVVFLHVQVLKKHGAMMGIVGNVIQLMANLPNAIQMEKGPAALTPAILLAGVDTNLTIADAKIVSIME